MPFPLLELFQAVEDLVPNSAAVGDPPFVLTVNGSAFVPGSPVLFDTMRVSPTFVSSTQLTVLITSVLGDSASLPAIVNVTVVNPTGGVSNVLPFPVKRGVDLPPPPPPPP